MLPWTIIGRFPTIWIVWVVLINISIVLYLQVYRNVIWFTGESSAGALWLLFVFNTVAVAIWEFSSETWNWLRERWAIRLLAVGSGFPITWLVVLAIFEFETGNIIPGITWMIWLSLMYFVYRRTRPDLFMLAGGCLSVITISTSFLGIHLLRNTNVGSVFVLSLLVIGLGSVAAFWLKSIQQELDS